MICQPNGLCPDASDFSPVAATHLTAGLGLSCRGAPDDHRLPRLTLDRGQTQPWTLTHGVRQSHELRVRPTTRWNAPELLADGGKRGLHARGHIGVGDERAEFVVPHGELSPQQMGIAWREILCGIAQVENIRLPLLI